MSGFFDWLDNAPGIVFGLLLFAQYVALRCVLWLVEHFQERR
jgi:hypothetical protein